MGETRLAMSDGSTLDQKGAADLIQQYRIEQFYYDEAAALDERRFEDWLEYFTEDSHYWMPVRRIRMNKEKGEEFTKRGEVAFFDDTKELLRIRVRKLESGFAWSEDPPSRTRRLISNVRILEQNSGQAIVTANFVVHRARYDDEEDRWFGRRTDTLQLSSEGFKIRNREIFLEQTVILSRNLSVLF